MKMTYQQRDQFLKIMKEHFKQAPTQESKKFLKESYDRVLQYRNLTLDMAISVLRINFTRFDKITTNEEMLNLINYKEPKKAIRVSIPQTGEIFEIQYNKDGNTYYVLKYILKRAKWSIEEDKTKPVNIIQTLINNRVWENENFKIEYLMEV